MVVCNLQIKMFLSVYRQMSREQYDLLFFTIDHRAVKCKVCKKTTYRKANNNGMFTKLQSLHLCNVL